MRRRRADVVLEVLPTLGDFVPAGAPMVHIKGQPRFDIESGVFRRISLDTERTFDQDLAYGPRLLVDICVRSLAEPSTPQPPYKPSTVSMTSCANWFIGSFGAASTATKPVRCGW